MHDLVPSHQRDHRILRPSVQPRYDSQRPWQTRDCSIRSSNWPVEHDDPHRVYRMELHHQSRKRSAAWSSLVFPDFPNPAYDVLVSHGNGYLTCAEFQPSCQIQPLQSWEYPGSVSDGPQLEGKKRLTGETAPGSSDPWDGHGTGHIEFECRVKRVTFQQPYLRVAPVEPWWWP